MKIFYPLWHHCSFLLLTALFVNAASETLEFTLKPQITWEGNNATITFAVNQYCDAAVAIENKDGRIVRHLAAGVLGPNAPEPFQKGSLRQALVWDGKNDRGEYVDNLENHFVRVSLGLKPRFERTLFWSPKKRTRDPNYLDDNLIFAVGPEGVHVYDGGNCEHIRLFDHEGNYVRTIYPPPASKLKDFDGLKWHRFPQDGQLLPLKWGLNQNTFLTTGNRDAGGEKWPVGGGNDVRAMAVRGARLLLACQRINRLATDGSTGGTKLNGPDVFVPTYVPGVHEWRGGVVDVPPTDIAFSADGKWVYLAGYIWSRSWMHGGLNGVGRIPAEGDGKLENFLGSLGEVSGSGRVEKSFTESVGGNPLTRGQFGLAASVAVDAVGRIYVADHLGNRLRVFDADGKHLKDVPVERPALVRVHPRTGEIYVFRYALPVKHFERTTDKPAMLRLASFENPVVVSTCPLDTTNWPLDSPPCRIAIDFWTDPPTIWMCDKARSSYGWEPQRLEKTCARLLVEKDGKLTVKRDFSQEAKAEIGFLRGARHGKQRLYFNPGNKKLYVGELHGPWPFHVTSMHDLPVIDPESGKVEVQKLPFDAEDMAFDATGLVHLRTADCIARYDPITWREVPYDYGEDLPAVTSVGLPHATRRVVSAITFAGVLGIASGQMGGMGTSPKGHIVISVCNPEKPPDLKAEKNMHLVTTRKYTPPLYPGRSRPWEVHIFDEHGRLVHADAVPGVGRMVGLGIDRNDDIYVMVCGVGRVGDEPYFNPLSCSYVKVKPGTKFYSTRAALPLPDSVRTSRPPDLVQVDTSETSWVDNPYWIRAGVGWDGKRVKCHCASQSRPALDYYGRSFLPEVDHYSVLVIDSADNEIGRVGRYGNVDDGVPLIREGAPAAPRSIGGDEVALMHAQMLAVETDRRLFISDLGNARIVSVRLDYHREEKARLKNSSTGG
ncbi:MAG: hypothetical protein ACUVWX_05895 [Kiritimatiellia bacterium]